MIPLRSSLALAFCCVQRTLSFPFPFFFDDFFLFVFLRVFNAMVAFNSVLVAALLPIAARAANDWSKPCFGECDWDIKDAGVSGTIRVVSTAFALSMYQREQN